MVVGLVASLMFHYIVEEKPRRGVLEEMNEELLQRDFVQPMGVRDWFCEPQFYQVAGFYMSTRLFVHLSQSYLPLYLQKTLKMKSTYGAIIPFVHMLPLLHDDEASEQESREEAQLPAGGSPRSDYGHLGLLWLHGG